MYFQMVKTDRNTHEQEDTNLYSTLVQSLWVLASRYNQEQDTHTYTIEERG